MKAGPKGSRDESPLAWKTRAKGARQFELFAARYLITPKGTGARTPVKVRPWQRQLVSTLLDDRVPLNVWVLPRGQGKSTLTAGLALHHVFMSGVEGARAVIVAQDERSAMRLLATAARMVSLNPELESRAMTYKDRIVIPGSDSQIIALPGEAHRVEGEDASLAIVDEIGFVRRDAYEATLHSTGKREGSQLLAIGTPSPPSWRDVSPLMDLVLDGRANPDSESLRLVEFAAPIGCDVDDEEAWAAANPGLDDLVQRSTLRASLPPRSRESEFRRARLGQWVEHDDSSFLPQGQWASLATGEGIGKGARVVLALDGSHSQDATAIVVATVSDRPHFDVGGLWEPPEGNADWRVPILDVENRIRELCREYQVVEIVADPFRWARTLQVLEGEGLPVTEFPQNGPRLTPATTELIQACGNGLVTHSGNKDLARHVSNAIVTEDARGIRLDKSKRGSSRRIDLAACLVMGHSRATWRAHKKPKRRRVRSFAA